MKYKLIIFDFDGTMFDVMPCFVEAYKKIISTNMTKAKIISFVRDKDFIPFFRYEKTNLLNIYMIVKETRNISIEKGKLFPEMKKLISQLKQDKIIISTNNKKVINYFIKNEKLEFEKILTPNFIFGKSHAIKKVMKNYKKKDVLYIGDEVTDIRSANKVGIDVAAVTWGANSKELLEKENPTYIVNKFEELKDII